MQRDFWLKHSALAPGPLVAVSHTVPEPLVTHLLDCKKDNSVASKYVEGDKISNMQGAWHSLVVPLAYPVWVNGQLGFENSKHVVKPMKPTHAPIVVLSAMVNPDFEFDNVMYEMIKVAEHSINGKQLPPGWVPPTAKDISEATELDLKQHFVYHFCDEGRLPALNDVNPAQVGSKYFQTPNGDLLSIGMLRNCMRAQLHVEMRGIDRICAENDITVLYTWDPPALFAKTVDHKLFDQLWVEAISAPGVLSKYVKSIAYNDFRNKEIIPKLRAAVPVPVCPKSELQVPDSNTVKLVHSNSDAFADHILTQEPGTSLEGAIGSCSSAAATFCTQKKRHYLYVPKPETE